MFQAARRYSQTNLREHPIKREKIISNKLQHWPTTAKSCAPSTSTSENMTLTEPCALVFIVQIIDFHT